MKKIVMRSLLIISVIYIIISSIYTFFYKAIAEETLEITEKTTEIIYNETFETNIGKQTSIDQRKIIEMLDINITILIVSVVLGIIISLMLEARENSKIKYILYFIFGNIIYNIFWMIITYFIIGMPIHLYRLISKYIDVMKSVFIPYVLLYIVVISSNILINKLRVNKLNETLNGKVENKKKKYIRYIIIILLITILLIFISNIGMKSYILIKYSDAVEKFNANGNYYVEMIFKNNATKYYYRDGIYKEISGNNIYYYNEKENKGTYITKENKVVISNKKYVTKPVYNHYFGDNSKRIWSNIAMAFNVKLKIEKIDGISYYVLERGTQKLYIDKETFLIKRITSINGTFEEGEIIYKESITEYVYKANIVTEKEMMIPDLSNYEIYTSVEELVNSYKK